MAVVINTQNQNILFMQTVISVLMDKGIVTDAEIKAATEKVESTLTKSESVAPAPIQA